MAVTTAAQRKALVRRFVDEVFNGKDYDVIDELWTDGFVQHGPISGMEMDADGAREYLVGVHEAFPDAECIEEYCIAEGDFVASYYTYHGTHEGAFMGVEPTGEECEIAGTILNRIEDGRIAETWTTVDFFALFDQVGALPESFDIGA